ncbi:hypothetical protein DL96DRAFT_106492 [Flagelloscypha sp. PMI_526]|nr:hypothetical protein DL96DRAFT_106492 [Flagelloscypha sp. PMI_526]
MRDLVDFVTNTLRRSNRIVSHAGLRQHNLFKSCSASEVASLNCIRILFERHENGLEGENLLQSLLERQSTEEILSTCAGWTIDDLYGIENVISNAPLFKYSLALVSTSRHRTSLKGIRDTLSQLRGQGDHVTTVVITCSQQIIVCAYIPVDRMKVFAIFEPQPRTANPNSTRWIICQGIGRTASYLQSILPFDDEPLTDPGYGWQGQLFTNFTSHFIQYKRPNARVQRQQLQELLQESTKTFLELQAKNMGPTEELGLSSQRNSRFSQKTVELNQENRFSTSISHQHHASPYSNDPRKLNGTQNPMLQPVHYTEVDDEDKRSLYYDEFGQVHYLNPVTSAQSPMRQPVHYPNIPLQYDNTSPASSVTTRPRDLEPLTRSMPPQPGPSRLVNIPRQDEVPSPLNGLAAQSRDLDSTTRSMPLQPVPNGYTNNPYSHDDTPKGTSGTLTAAIRSMYPHHDIYNPRQDDATRARDLDLSIHSTPTQPGPSPYADDSFDDEDVSAFNTIQSGSSNTVTRPLSPQPGPSRYMNLHYGEGSSTSSDRNRPSGSSTVLTPVNAMPQPLHYPIDPFEDEDLPSQVNYIPPNAVSTPIGYQSPIKSATTEKQRSLDSIYDPPLRDDDASDWTNFFRSDGVNIIPNSRDQPSNNTIQQIYPVPHQSYHLHNENPPVLDLVPQVQESPTPRAISPQPGPSFLPNNPPHDDDLSALDELARTLGWKYCPGIQDYFSIS